MNVIGQTKIVTDAEGAKHMIETITQWIALRGVLYETEASF
jgi:hypothetical protein